MLTGLLEKESIFSIGLNVTVTGLVIVFMGLILLVIVISVFSKIFHRKTKKIKKFASDAARRKTENVEVSPALPEETNPAEDDIRNEEIIAVIAAAASVYDGSGKKPVIKSVKRSETGRSVWATAGLIDNTRAF